MNKSRLATHDLYVQSLREPRAQLDKRGFRVCGVWLPDDQTSVEALYEGLLAVERSGDSTVLKESRVSRVTKGTLFGREVLIKRYALVGLAKK